MINNNSNITNVDNNHSTTDSKSLIQNKLLYTQNSFLTCRDFTNSFFLCQIREDIYNDTVKPIPIQRCSIINKNNDQIKIDEKTHFKLDYDDTIDITTILMEIKHIIHHSDHSISLKKEDIIQTNQLLKKSTKVKKRRELIDGQPALIRKRRRTKSIDEIVKEPSVTPRAKLFKVESNRFLKENPTIPTYKVDPFFEDNLPVPFISSSVQSKLAIRAVILNDEILLQNLIDDINQVSSVHIKRDFPESLSAIHYAIQRNNIDLLRILLKDLKEPKDNRCHFPEVIIEEQSTGEGTNMNSIGSSIVEITAKRGVRKSNDALLKDINDNVYPSFRKDILIYAMKTNCSRQIYDLISEKLNTNGYKNIYNCIQAGHRKLAASIINDILRTNNYDFNKLHYEVLMFDEEDLFVNNVRLVFRKARGNFQITPIHCAAINPNPKYLKQLLSIVAQYNIMDKNRRRPIHYAAACEGSEPLKYLLSKNVKFNHVDRDKNSPLHIAVNYGRSENAEILLQTAKEKAESNDPDDQTIYEKFGLASINQMNKLRYSPLHLATLNNHFNCVKILVEYGANRS